jgi:hypothetical protein
MFCLRKTERGDLPLCFFDPQYCTQARLGSHVQEKPARARSLVRRDEEGYGVD